MENKKGKKRTILLCKEGLFLCLVIFSLLSSSLSLEGGVAKVIGSSGAIMYSNNANLLVTDSTPEGSVPYKIDETSGYQTGLTYTLPAGVHTIELPSPYSSPISAVTYNFSYWQDGSTENPRTVSLDSDAITSFHGIYSTSSTPPPNSEWLAWTDWEGVTVSSPWRENNGLSWLWINIDADVSIDTATSQSPTHSLKAEKWGQRMTLAFRNYFDSDGELKSLYTSSWYYIPSSIDIDWGWQFWQIFDDHAPWIPSGPGAQLSIHFFGSRTNLYWDIGYLTHQSAYEIPGTFNYHIYSDHWTGWSGGDVYAWTPGGGGTPYFITVTPGASNLIINPHEVPFDRWFRLEVYVYRDRTNGVMSVWITDPDNPDPSKRETRTLFHAETIWTAYDPTANFGLQPAVPMKMYGSYGTMWFDDLYIANYNAHGQGG